MEQVEYDGQLSPEEFASYYDCHGKSIKLADGEAVTGSGRTINYWRRHPDGSWTNYDCRTKSGAF